MINRFRLSIMVALMWAISAWTSGGARADPIVLDFTVRCAPCDFTGFIPVGLSNFSVFSGSLTIDNQAGNSVDAITRLDYVTGSKVWTLDEIESVFVIYGADGFLQDFLIQFDARSTRTSSLITSQGAWGVFARSLGSITCNDCVTFSQSLAAVPEPNSLALVGVGLLALGIGRWRAVATG